MKDFSGKVAFITGGSSGIGLGIAKAFVDAGMKVIITYRTTRHRDSAMKVLESADGQVHSIKVEVTDRSSMEAAADEAVEVFGKIHVLVNNAGMQGAGALSTTSYAEWDQLMAVNVGGVFNAVHALLPHIKKHGEGGQIVSTASVLGIFTLSGASAAYCASKFAVVAMMEALRAELIHTNIGVSVLCPGLVKSNLGQNLLEHPAASDPYEVGRQLLQGIYDNHLYILTHPEFEPVMRARSAALVASIPRGVKPSDARMAMARSSLENSVYVTELESVAGSNGSVRN
jgi:NAD(P)-dependent dehydrogenase (short-subunit alcohol dehydrogenase family)